MTDDPAFIWDRKPVGRPPRHATTASRPGRAPSGSGTDSPPSGRAVEFSGRITLREAESRFGVPVTKLRAWARNGDINGVMGSGPNGGRLWFVTPESVAHQLSRTSTDHGPPDLMARAGPTPDGAAMLVPRDAWDRLMDQLGNLHTAGVQLAEARERAARAETEATFLRERLAELRGERDELKQRLDTPTPRPEPPRQGTPPPTVAARLREAYRRVLGR